MTDSIRRFRDWIHELTSSRYLLHLETRVHELETERAELTSALLQSRGVPVSYRPIREHAIPTPPAKATMASPPVAKPTAAASQEDAAIQQPATHPGWQAVKKKLETESRKRASMSEIERARIMAENIAEAQANVIEEVRKAKAAQEAKQNIPLPNVEPPNEGEMSHAN